MTNLLIPATDGRLSRRALGWACPHCGERLALTWDQQQAMTLIAYGASSREIALQLGLGSANPDSTAADQLVARALDNLGAASRSQGVDIAYRAMLLPAPKRATPLNRDLTHDEREIMRCLVFGHTVTETAALLRLKRARVEYVLGRLTAELAIPEGPGRTVTTVHRLHGARLLPDNHPCRCLLAADPAAERWVRGIPCPSCRVRPVLTSVDHTVLGLLAAGRSDQEIGEHFGTTRVGGTRRVQKTLWAMGAAGRVHAVDIGCRTRLLAPPTDPRDPRELVKPHDLHTMEELVQGYTLADLAEHGGPSRRALKSQMTRFYERLGTNAASPCLAAYTLHGLGVLPREHPCQCGTPSRDDLPPQPNGTADGSATQDYGALQP
ncbi:hypothetical protein ACFVUH_08035 [Kitasatospora sp. NPDC058032]|uniref:helix-turn-helix transcriptional regulator n=1 Tax=Kitasatospora sp. NPDC058032 TaxID=3346307 RepID=UPI0036D962E3